MDKPREAVPWRSTLSDIVDRFDSLLPVQVSSAQFMTLLDASVTETPALELAEPSTLRYAVIEAATMGLLPLHECELMLDEEGEVPEVWLLPRLSGLTRCAYRSNQVRRVVTGTVHKGDIFTGAANCLADTPPVHQPRGAGKTRRVVRYYAVVMLLNGAWDMETLSADDMEELRQSGHSPNHACWQERSYDRTAQSRLLGRVLRRMRLDAGAPIGTDAAISNLFGDKAAS